jgi:hypothetical protein
MAANAVNTSCYPSPQLSPRVVGFIGDMRLQESATP